MEPQGGLAQRSAQRDHTTASGSSFGVNPCGDTYLVVGYNPYDAVHLGVSALPNVAAGAAGGIATSTQSAAALNTLARAFQGAIQAAFGAESRSGATVLAKDEAGARTWRTFTLDSVTNPTQRS
jgi:hypothetical protein